MITNLNKNDDGLIAPNMDTNIAVRRILAIINAAGVLSGGRVLLNVDTSAGSGTPQSINNVLAVGAPSVATRLPNVACKAVLLVALQTNTSFVYVGGSGVKGTTQSGVTLSATGMLSCLFNVSNLQDLYINADVAGEGVGVIYFT